MHKTCSTSYLQFKVLLYCIFLEGPQIVSFPSSMNPNILLEHKFSQPGAFTCGNTSTFVALTVFFFWFSAFPLPGQSHPSNPTVHFTHICFSIMMQLSCIINASVIIDACVYHYPGKVWCHHLNPLRQEANESNLENQEKFYY